MNIKIDARILAAVLCLGALVNGCDRAPVSTPASNTEWIDPKQLTPGPVVHDALTEDQMRRVERVQKIFSEVDSSPLEKWVDDFKRDMNPDREIRIWEEMANAFKSFTDSKPLDSKGKMEVFQLVLLRSAAPEDEVLKQIKLTVLTQQEAKQVMAYFTNAPAPLQVISR